MDEKQFPLINKVFPEHLTRLQFFIYTTVLGLFLGFLGGLGFHPFSFYVYLLVYLFYAIARVKDWDGKPTAWFLFLILIVYPSVLVPLLNLEQSTDLGLVALFFPLCHLFFLFKKGKHTTPWYENLKNRTKEKNEIMKLKREKSALDKKIEKEKLRKEIDELKQEHER